MFFREPHSSALDLRQSHNRESGHCYSNTFPALAPAAAFAPFSVAAAIAVADAAKSDDLAPGNVWPAHFAPAQL